MSKSVRLSGNKRFRMADHAYRRFVAEPLSGTTIKQIMSPEYFVNFRRELMPNTVVSVISEDGIIDLELRVLRVKETGVITRLLIDYMAIASLFDSDVSLPPVSRPMVSEGVPEGYKVEFVAGGGHKHRVVFDGEVVSKRHATRDEAVAWAIKDYKDGD